MVVSSFFWEHTLKTDGIHFDRVSNTHLRVQERDGAEEGTKIGARCRAESGRALLPKNETGELKSDEQRDERNMACVWHTCAHHNCYYYYWCVWWRWEICHKSIKSHINFSFFRCQISCFIGNQSIKANIFLNNLLIFFFFNIFEIHEMWLRSTGSHTSTLIHTPMEQHQQQRQPANRSIDWIYD